MPQSPELAGGAGFTYEGAVAAYYLAALLAEAYAPGINDRIVVGVSVQQRDFGEPLDDVIVDFEDSLKNPARLSLQVKRSLVISAAQSNQGFREIIRDSWATLNKSDFRVNVDRYGAAVGTITSAKKRALTTLCGWARESLTPDHFEARFVEGGSASAAITAVKNDVTTLLEAARGMPCTSEEVHQFLGHFVLMQFDFLCEGAANPSDAINRIRECLVPDDAAKAPLVWSRAIELSRSSAGKSGQIDRMRLVREIAPVARLRGAVSLSFDLEKLAELAQSYVNLIPDDIGGTKLDRVPLIEDLGTKLTKARVVQIRGLPGSGKSVVVKRAVQHALQRGPTLFLKAEQLEGANWTGYATSQGLSGAPLRKLLVEIGAAGNPTLFIDAIDRIEKEHQPIIIDLFQAIVETKLLDNWRIVVSLRDTGIEVLRNWLGRFLEVLNVETIEVGLLNDEEAETLAKSKQHLSPLLFGLPEVRAIVRRPFFAKVLNQSYSADSSAPKFTPQSEVDLIENWWRRGGYNETGQSKIDRQRTLLDLANLRSRHLSQPINLGQLNSVAHIGDLISDGILQNVREGISVRFAHDIFFEWSFFHVLAESGSQWLEEIKACGEPPAVARVVELASQWEYGRGTDWQTYLNQAESSELRSQWLRAWLIGPLGTVNFEVDEDQFARAVFSNDFRLFRKALVWFQAEKTSPSEQILAGNLPWEQRQLAAYHLGWPSDPVAWQRLIGFILRRISDIPQRLYSEIVAIFEVWQNIFAGHRNKTSQALLQKCASWLATIDEINSDERPNENFEIWREVPDLESLSKSLCGLLLRSSNSEPRLAADYLQRVINSKRVQDGAFRDIVVFLPLLAQSLHKQIVELSLKFLREELPTDKVDRKREELRKLTEWRKGILDKPEAERSRKEVMALSRGPSIQPIDHFSNHEWETLSIHRDHSNFWPPSPLREPFHSLFQSSPDEALRLLRGLCNHATTAWRQLHRHSYDRKGTPIPLELAFPWGTQEFWGTDQVYLWFRSMRAPHAIGCAFMALEEWCFAELERNQNVDELIQKIVEGNDCIAILGIASVLALHTKTVSETTLPLFTSQRLLAADQNRLMQESSSTMNLLGFRNIADTPHVEAIRTANSRSVRETQLLWMVPGFIIAKEPLSSRVREAILNFRNDLPYQYEEQREITEQKDLLTDEALRFAEWADPENYRVYLTGEDSDQIAVVHESPSAASPENVARVAEATQYLRQHSLRIWASKSFDENTLNNSFTIKDAIVFAKETDASNLFEHLNGEQGKEQLGIRRGAVAATAATVLNFREGCSQEDLKWARDVLGRAIHLQERFDPMWFPESDIPWHQGIFVARGIAADIREDTAAQGAAQDLLIQIAHPLEVVSLTALEEACKFWSNDSKLVWAALILAFSLCRIPSRPHGDALELDEPIHSTVEAQDAVNRALAFYDNGSGWAPLPLPPPAWVKVGPGISRRRLHGYDLFDIDVEIEEADMWDEPEVSWHSKRAAEFLKRIPFDEVLSSSARSVLLDFLTSVLEWTIQKKEPPWLEPGQRDRSEDRMYQWTLEIGSSLGRVAGLIPLAKFQNRLLDPILNLEGENCWELLFPFTDTYVCEFVYDAPVAPKDTVELLDLCLGRFLQNSAFNRDDYRSGELPGIDQSRLVRTLMFVSIDHADLSARFVNGDWSEIGLIMPLIDRFIRAGGWAASVMDPFLTLCERSRDNYPAEDFADQVSAIINDGPDNLKGWHGSSIPARIAVLVQHFANRDAPMNQALAQKFLRILDFLVDMGDRRSVALQLDEAFREIRLPS